MTPLVYCVTVSPPLGVENTGDNVIGLTFYCLPTLFAVTPAGINRQGENLKNKLRRCWCRISILTYIVEFLIAMVNMVENKSRNASRLLLSFDEQFCSREASRSFLKGSQRWNKDGEVSSVGSQNDLSQRGNIIGKNAIGSYCQIELCEPKVSRGP